MGLPPLLRCRQCAGALSLSETVCACGSRTPFACAVCGRALASVSVAIACTEVHPHGAFTPEGELRCHEHRLTACRACGELHPQGAMRRLQTGIHADRENRRGMSPRYEPVFGYFCPHCQEGAGDSGTSRPATAGPERRPDRGWLWAVRVALVLFGAFLLLAPR